MAIKTQAKYSKIKKVVVVQGTKRDVWPSTQPLLQIEGAPMKAVQFEDVEDVNAGLAETILALEKNPRFGEIRERGGCGNKVRDIHLWKSAEANLIHARALTLFTRMLNCSHGFVDDCWANVYRNGDYCMPHSHLRSVASVVYMVDLGDEDPAHPLSGRFYFADPRLHISCETERDRMTRLVIPDLKAGSMIVFPGAMVHAVNPYTGQRPRITMSWNITQEALPGNAPKMQRMQPFELLREE